MTFGLCHGSKNFDKLLSVSYEVCVFAQKRLNPLSGKILYHDSVPVIVSWFTSPAKDFVIRRYQVTKLFCPRQIFASASSARSPCHFGSQADVAISVSCEPSLNTVLPWFCCHFRRMFRIWVVRTVRGCIQFCVLQTICELLQPLRKICQRVVRNFTVITLFWCFLRDRTCFRVPFRHFAPLLELKMNLKRIADCCQWLFPLLFSTIPVVAM